MRYGLLHQVTELERRVDRIEQRLQMSATPRTTADDAPPDNLQDWAAVAPSPSQWRW